MWKHFRGLSMCLLLLVFPVFMAFKISQFFHMDFWLLILVSSCMLTSLQVRRVTRHDIKWNKTTVVCNILNEKVCFSPRLQAPCWSTPSSWWSCSAATPSRAWTKWSTGWTPSAGCWSSWWRSASWRTAPGSRCSGSGAGWARPSLSSTRTSTFGSELSLAGGASCSDRKRLRRSTPSREPRLNSCSSTTTCAPSASRWVVSKPGRAHENHIRLDLATATDCRD